MCFNNSKVKPQVPTEHYYLFPATHLVTAQRWRTRRAFPYCSAQGKSPDPTNAGGRTAPPRIPPAPHLRAFSQPRTRPGLSSPSRPRAPAPLPGRAAAGGAGAMWPRRPGRDPPSPPAAARRRSPGHACSCLPRGEGGAAPGAGHPTRRGACPAAGSHPAPRERLTTFFPR